MRVARVLDLSKPVDARYYIARFEIAGTPSRPTFIETNTGKKIVFAEMTDEEACLAAHLLYDLELEANARAAIN